MGCNHRFISSYRLCNLTISLLLLILSSTQFTFTAEGRYFKTKKPFVEPVNSAKTVSEGQEAILRALIGSRPPRCERRCSSCAHCEAIQVPANPQIKPKSGTRNSTTIFTIAYSRGDDTSNYKPMSWKCKCGNFIFNP